MTVVCSKVLGYCMGVRRAIELTFDAAKKYKNVFTYGELIHNAFVLEELEKLNIKIIYSTEERVPLNGAAVVLCAHGAPPDISGELLAKGALVIDATCPVVRKNQLKAKELLENGTTLFLAGEKDHSEITGIKGYNPAAIVVSGAKEASLMSRELKLKAEETGVKLKTALLAQTTISSGEYDGIADVIKNYFPALIVHETICAATEKRQEALRALCGEVDAVLVAGSPTSSNTKRLFAIAKGEGKPAYLAGRADEIPEEVFSFKKIGLSAGASTPDSVIEEIKAALRER